MHKADAQLVTLFLEPIRKCAVYTPAFGKGKTGGIRLDDFQALYGADPFYAWLGLDNPLVYASHKAAGGLTSLYRQIGVGSERMFRAILRTSLGLSDVQMQWSYSYARPNGKKGRHTLDALIKSNDLAAESQQRFEKWMASVKRAVSDEASHTLLASGAVFEVRQGYKSADAKRQNADLRFGMRAYQAGLLPILVVMSTQVSEPVIRRYRTDGMLVLTGSLADDPTTSTFAFFQQVVGFDLAGFLQRNSSQLRKEIHGIVQTLLTP